MSLRGEYLNIILHSVYTYHVLSYAVAICNECHSSGMTLFRVHFVAIVPLQLRLHHFLAKRRIEKSTLWSAKLGMMFAQSVVGQVGRNACLYT